MAGLMNKAVRIGVIAEEKNDVEVIYELTCKVIRENQFLISKFLGHGCGKVRGKSQAWAQNLLAGGCLHLVMVHDLDTRDEQALRTLLENKIDDSDFEQKVILIPVEEIEAWLLSDSEALKTVFNMRKLPKVPRWPEKIKNPKEFLGEVVRKNSKSQYLNTIHNKHIANALSISKLNRCPSFSPYPEFLKSAFPKASSHHPKSK